MVADGRPKIAARKSVQVRKAKPIRDTETGKEYRSEYQAGKALYWLVGEDIKDTFVWFKILRAFPDRFQKKNSDGEWVHPDDPSVEPGTTLPDGPDDDE